MFTVYTCFAEEEDLAAFAQYLAPLLQPGDFLALFGGMGAGKTTFMRYLGAYMGADDIASPTFTIVQEHDTTPPLFHFDAYRLEDADELYAIGFADYLSRGGVIAMEWCERVPEVLPAERLEIHLEGSGDAMRTLRIVAMGPHYERIMEELCLPIS